jgi:hypothetical protein
MLSFPGQHAPQPSIAHPRPPLPGHRYVSLPVLLVLAAHSDLSQERSAHRGQPSSATPRSFLFFLAAGGELSILPSVLRKGRETEAREGRQLSNTFFLRLQEHA